ncbi:MAG: phage holin family protein [Chloroflexi bacterium]|nr:MAG: phage holin family protein [Chloroflexota bacterium]
MQPQRDERSIGQLFAELANETSTLVRQEVQLAKTEVTQKVTSAGKDAGMIGAGGALAYAGLLAVLAAVIIGLGQLIPMWLSALLVGLVVIGVGYALIQSGLNALKRIDPTPSETIQTIKEDVDMVKEQTR